MVTECNVNIINLVNGKVQVIEVKRNGLLVKGIKVKN